jgi:hypothetical protein
VRFTDEYLGFDGNYWTFLAKQILLIVFLISIGVME